MFPREDGLNDDELEDLMIHSCLVNKQSKISDVPEIPFEFFNLKKENTAPPYKGQYSRISARSVSV